MKRTYSHIDLDERRKIARWRMAGLSVDVIAEKLGRHRSTIFRELKRNTSARRGVRLNKQSALGVRPKGLENVLRQVQSTARPHCFAGQARLSPA